MPRNCGGRSPENGKCSRCGISQDPRLPWIPCTFCTYMLISRLAQLGSGETEADSLPVSLAVALSLPLAACPSCSTLSCSRSLSSVRSLLPLVSNPPSLSPPPPTILSLFLLLSTPLRSSLFPACSFSRSLALSLSLSPPTYLFFSPNPNSPPFSLLYNHTSPPDCETGT